MKTRPPDQGSNQSVGKAFALLKTFEAGHARLRAADLSRLCGLQPSTVSRLLASLVGAGMLERAEDGSYQLGPAVITLAGVALNGSAVYREAKTVAYEISCKTGLGVNVAELRGDSVFYLVHFDGLLAPRSYTLIGQRNLLYCTGLGKSLVAFLPVESQQLLIKLQQFVAHTPRTIVDGDEFMAELATVRERGYATECEELALGRACVAAPIKGRDGEPIAAISISGSLVALNLQKNEASFAQMVIEAADRIGAAVPSDTATAGNTGPGWTSPRGGARRERGIANNQTGPRDGVNPRANRSESEAPLTPGYLGPPGSNKELFASSVSASSMCRPSPSSRLFVLAALRALYLDPPPFWRGQAAKDRQVSCLK